MKVKSIGRVAAVGFAAVVAASMVASPASADPTPLNDYRTLAGTGSDTTQDVMNGLGGVIVSGGNEVIASWDARGSATVKTKATGCEFGRPNGSGNGRLALRASEGEDIGQGGAGQFGGVAVNGCVDFARSSAYPGATPQTTGTYTYVPFGVDAVALAKNAGGDLPTVVSLAQAQRVYRCLQPDIGGVPVNPVMLQSGSGTWTFWMAQVGITEVEIGLGDYNCLAFDHDSNPGTPVQPRIPRAQEHDGTVLNGNLSYVVPFSAAQYIAQTNAATILAETGVTVADRRGQASLTGTRLSGQPVQQPIVGGALNINFPLRRDVYNMVPTADLGQPVIASTFVGASSAVCTASVNVNGTQRTVIELFGFGKRTTRVSPLAAECGYDQLRFNS